MNAIGTSRESGKSAKSDFSMRCLSMTCDDRFPRSAPIEANAANARNAICDNGVVSVNQQRRTQAMKEMDTPRIVLSIFRPRGRRTYQIVCNSIDEAGEREAYWRSNGYLVTRNDKTPKPQWTARERARRERLKAKQRAVREALNAKRRAARSAAIKAHSESLKTAGLMDMAEAVSAAQRLAPKLYVQAAVTTSIKRAMKDAPACTISLGRIRSVAGIAFNVIEHWVEATTFEDALVELRARLAGPSTTPGSGSAKAAAFASPTPPEPKSAP